MNLSESIKQYYFGHFDELPLDKQFHFVSRLAAWEGNPDAKTRLKKLEAFMSANGNPKAAFEKILEAPIGRLYGKELRQPYFDKYTRLFGIHNALFRLRHLKEIYGIDARSEFLGLVSIAELDGLYHSLIDDTEAFRILSRFAVDFIFLYEILFEKRPRLQPSAILAMSDCYDLSSDTELHLLIYLFTHSIIADSNFYIRKVPEDRLRTYHAMLRTIGDLLRKYEDIKLDNKFEFLVACRICGLDSPLFATVEAQAERSLSPFGTFIIDRLAGDEHAGLNKPARAEHRNVLFIMSQTAYRTKEL